MSSPSLELLLKKLPLCAQGKKYAIVSPGDAHAECNTLAFGPEGYPILDLVRVCRLRLAKGSREENTISKKRTRKDDVEAIHGYAFVGIQDPLYASLSQRKWPSMASPPNVEAMTRKGQTEGEREGGDNKALDDEMAVHNRDTTNNNTPSTLLEAAMKATNYATLLRKAERKDLEASIALPVAHDILHLSVRTVELTLSEDKTKLLPSPTLRQRQRQATDGIGETDDINYTQHREGNRGADGSLISGKGSLNMCLGDGLEDRVCFPPVADIAEMGERDFLATNAHQEKQKDILVGHEKRYVPARFIEGTRRINHTSNYLQNLAAFDEAGPEERAILEALRTPRTSTGLKFSDEDDYGKWDTISEQEIASIHPRADSLSAKDVALPPSLQGDRMLALVMKNATLKTHEKNAEAERQLLNVYLKRVTWLEKQKTSDSLVTLSESLLATESDKSQGGSITGGELCTKTWGALTESQRVQAELARTMKQRMCFHRARNMATGDGTE